MRIGIWGLAFTLLLPALGAGPSSSGDDRPIGWSRVPQEIREQLHWNINQIPPYPEDDHRLMNVGWWPKTRVFDGKEYVQEFWGWRGDVGKPRMPSLAEINSGWKYGTYYVRYSGKRRSKRGPAFMWYPDSSLYEKSYRTPSSSQSWFYDLQGKLRVYMETVHGSGRKPGKSSIESFGTDGYLVGCEIGHVRTYYWMGAELGREQYQTLRGKFWKWE